VAQGKSEKNTRKKQSWYYLAKIWHRQPATWKLLHLYWIILCCL